MISAILIEDEVSNRQNLRAMLQQYCGEQVEVKGEAGEVGAAIDLVKKVRPQLLFLDVRIRGGNGFQVLDGVIGPERMEVIFTTGYEHFALQAIKYTALDYLLKPIHPDELVQAVRKAERSLARVSSPALPLAGERLSIPTTEGIILLPVSEIVWLEALGSYTRIYFRSDPPFVASKNLSELEKLLPPFSFFRIHRSYAIQLAHIRLFRSGDNKLELVEGTVLPVSRRRRSGLLDQLRNQSRGG